MDNPQGTERDLVYLLACALNENQPEAERVAGMDLDALYRLCCAQSLGCMTAAALLSSGALAQQEQKRWREERDKAIRKNILLDAERAQIEGFLEQEGIWYADLKGTAIQGLYPAFGMRQMADNDIWVDRNGRKKIRAYMKSRGYHCTAGEAAHDAYTKPPVYNFEIHWRLLDPDTMGTDMARCCDQMEKRLRPKAGTRHGRTMRLEDQYIYLTIHAFKHLSHAGTGLRTVLDFAVCTRAWKDMDWAFVAEELKQVGLDQFEQMMRGLAGKLFSKGSVLEECDLTMQEAQLLEFMLHSGTYGSLNRLIRNQMDDIERNSAGNKDSVLYQYLFHRLFPPFQLMRKGFPVLRRLPWLLPVCYVVRMFRGAVLGSSRTLQEIRIAVRYRNE